MNSKHIYYSCSTWLAYNSCQHYYGQKHYAWCSPYFDTFSKLSLHNSMPPSSNPRDIYWSLKKDVDNGDMHSAKVRGVRRGILKGAGIKRKAGIITSVEHTEILEIVAGSVLADFRPLMFVIPVQPVAGSFKAVAIKHRANPLSEEYTIENLSREFFDAFEL
jgi:hypothetical protein